MAWQPGQKIAAQRLRDETIRVVSYDAITTNYSGSAITTTETATVTSSPITFRTGRAYRFSLKVAVQSTVAMDRMTVRLRKTNAGGAVYIEVPHVVTPAANTNQLAESSVFASNDTGADITASLALTLVRVSGTGNVITAGSAAAFVGHILVEDYAASSAVPNSRAIT
ncbi:hypothetical protein ACWEJP_20940 [Streptomyces sp. NPDC004749]